MKDSPLVSIVVPVYNVEDWLGQCIESLLEQTLKNIEIICVNDGSTDGSGEILQKYRDYDSRIRIVDQENQGLSAARNTGIRCAHGKYLYFMDSDDYIDRDTIKLCSERMESQALEFLTFNAVAFGEDTETAILAGERNKGYFKRNLENNNIYTGQELFRKLKRDGSYITTAWSCMVLRTSVLEHNLFFHHGILHEDEPWTFKVLLSLSRCGCLSNIFYHYRLRSGSISLSKQSFYHAYGIFSGFLDAKRIFVEKVRKGIDEDIIDLCIDHISAMQQNAIRAYRACDQEEKNRIKELDPYERMQFAEMVIMPAALMNENADKDRVNKELHAWCDSQQRGINEISALLSEKENEVKKLNASIIALRTSASFRIGNKIVSIPRKMHLNEAGRKIYRIIRGEKNNYSNIAEIKEDAKTNRIDIQQSTVNGNRIIYHYHLQGEWKNVFKKESSFEIQYPYEVECIPESIRVIPLLSEILPASWVCDAEIHVPVCDWDFYECIENVKNGYKRMYPTIEFKGKIIAEQIIKNNRKSDSKRALVCFSGGVDAVSTVIAHLNESPLLVSIWGADIPQDDEAAWNPVIKTIQDTASKLGLEQITIRSEFREVLREDELALKVISSGDDWWHGFQHGIGILGHMALAVWQKGISTVYIASSFTADDIYTCASDPTIDNNVQYCGARVVHDGYELDRQAKIKSIVALSDKNKLSLSLHVCWKNRGGENCCHCEKCWRTILALYAERVDPRKFGFFDYDGLDSLSDDLEADRSFLHGTLVANYSPIQKELRKNYSEQQIPEELEWLFYGDLARIKTGEIRLHQGKILPPIWFLGIPEYGNIGDQCIVDEGEKFIKTIFPESHVLEISEEALLQEDYAQIKDIPPSAPVFLPGGGNLGTLWPGPEGIREEIIRRLPHNPVVILPQSIHFSNDDDGSKALERAKKVYCGDNVLLCCRDEISYRFAIQGFNCKVMLVPDIVMWADYSTNDQQDRFGALTLLRKDDERKITDEEQKAIEDTLAKHFHAVEVDDTVQNSWKVTKDNRETEIEKIIRRITSVECVVTDRLHGMILCAITGTPCIVLRNNYHKIEACYEWIKEVQYIKLINDVKELEKYIHIVCTCEKKQYPKTEMRTKFQELTDYLGQNKDFFRIE